MMNPMQMLTMFSQIRGSNNPMQLMNGMFGNNPNFNMAMKMAQGKSPQELEQVVKNICSQKGIDINQAKNVANNIGIKL